MYFLNFFFIELLKDCLSSPPEVLLGNSAQKICSKFTGEHICRNAVSINLQSNYIENALRYGYSPINLLHINFRTPFHKNTSRGVLSDCWLNDYTGFKTFYGLVVKVLDSQSRSPLFKTTGWLQV